MAETSVEPASQPAEGSAPWFCKNCGMQNKPADSECLRCGFTREYDPEAKLAVDMTAVQRVVDERSSEVQRRLRFYYEIVKNLLLLIVAVYVLLISIRLYSTWPFQSVFERDSEQLADVVLLMQGRLKAGLSKGQYDELLIELQVQNTKFKLKYGETVERERVVYQKLVQAAEYYAIADEAWDKQLIDEGHGRVDPASRSENANDDVKRYWETAASNVMLAIEDLH